MENTSEELKRLTELPSKELLKEYTEARERFRNFLKASGINVPDIIIDNNSEPGFAGGQKSILLDEFSGETISSIDDTVLTVYSTVEAFLKLFEKIVASNVLEDITVTVEGRDPCTAKDLKEQVEAGKVAKDGQLVVASSDLKMLLPDLGIKVREPSKHEKAEKSEKAAVLSEADIKGIFEQKETPEPPKEEAKKKEKAPEQAKEQKKSGEFSPVITQKEYDELMGVAKAPAPEAKAENETKSIPAEEEKAVQAPKTAEKAKPPAPKATKGETKQTVEKSPSAPAPTPSAKKAESDTSLLSQAELDALMSSKPSAAAPPPKDNGKAAADSNSVSQAELDELLKANASAKTETKSPDTAAASQAEIDALLNAGTAKKEEKTSADSSNISQNELDALFAAKAETPKASAKTESKSSDSAAASQAEIDALLNAGTAKKEEASTVSQKELDELLDNKKPAETVKKEEKPAVSQKEIDELLKKPVEPIKQEIGPASSSNSSIASQSEVDALLSILSKTDKQNDKNNGAKTSGEKAEKSAVSQDELDALFSASKAKDKK